MPARASLLRSAGTLGLAVVIARLANLVVIVALARTAGERAVGLYGLATLIGSFVALAFSLGFPSYLTRSRAAAHVGLDELNAIHALRIVATGLAACGLFAGAQVALTGASAVGFAGLAAAVLLDQLNETAWANIRGTMKAHREAVVNGATYASLLAAVAGLAVQGSLDLETLGIAAFGIAILRSALAVFAAGLTPSLRSCRSGIGIRRHVRSAMPYLSSDVLGLAYLRGDTLVLAIFVPAAVLGDYVAATALVAPLVQVGAAMSMGALASATSAPAGSESEDATRLAAFFLRTGLAIGGALCVALPMGVVLLYGNGHAHVAELAGVLTLFLPIRFFNFALSSLTLARGLAVTRLYVVAASVVVNVVLNVVLDPWAQADGAAWATVITEVIVLGAFLLALKPARALMFATALLMMGVLVAALALAATHAGLRDTFAGGASGAALLATLALTLLFRRTASRPPVMQPA